jgi:hypothetical protein
MSTGLLGQVAQPGKFLCALLLFNSFDKCLRTVFNSPNIGSFLYSFWSFGPLSIVPWTPLWTRRVQYPGKTLGGPPMQWLVDTFFCLPVLYCTVPNQLPLTGLL